MYSLQSFFFLSFVFSSFSQVHFCSWEFGRSLYKNDFCSQPSWNSARFTFLPKEVCRTNQIWNGWNSWTKKLIKIGSRSWAATYIGTTSSLKFSVSIKKWRFKWERERENVRPSLLSFNANGRRPTVRSFPHPRRGPGRGCLWRKRPARR